MMQTTTFAEDRFHIIKFYSVSINNTTAINNLQAEASYQYNRRRITALRLPVQIFPV